MIDQFLPGFWLVMDAGMSCRDAYEQCLRGEGGDGGGGGGSRDRGGGSPNRGQLSDTPAADPGTGPDSPWQWTPAAIMDRMPRDEAGFNGAHDGASAVKAFATLQEWRIDKKEVTGNRTLFGFDNIGGSGPKVWDSIVTITDCLPRRLYFTVVSTLRGTIPESRSMQVRTARRGWTRRHVAVRGAFTPGVP